MRARGRGVGGTHRRLRRSRSVHPQRRTHERIGFRPGSLSRGATRPLNEWGESSKKGSTVSHTPCPPHCSLMEDWCSDLKERPFWRNGRVYNAMWLRLSFVLRDADADADDAPCSALESQVKAWGPACCWSGTRPSIFKGLGASLSPCLFEPVDPFFSAPCGARQRSRVLVWQLLFSRSLVVVWDGPPRGEDG